MNNTTPKKSRYISKLLASGKLSDKEKDLIKDFKDFLKNYNHLTYNQTRALYNIYHKYYVNISEAKKENKSLNDF